MTDQQWEEINKNARTKASEKKRKVEALKEAKNQKEEEEEVTLNLNRALKEAQEKRKTLEIKEKERKRIVHATDDAPKMPVRKLKSEVLKMTGKDLQNEIDREAQALNDANRDSNLNEMAVKITKMGPEVHAAYVKDKKESTSGEATAGGSSAGNTLGGRKIPLLRDVGQEKEDIVAGSCQDPRVNKGDIPKVVQTLAEVHYDAGDVESDSAGEEEEFNRVEVERVQINLPSEAYASRGCESEDDIMININAEAEELAREEEETEGQSRIKEISRELEESSREAGLLPLPPIASIVPSRGKGGVGNTKAATPGGTSVPGARLRLEVHRCREARLRQ